MFCVPVGMTALAEETTIEFADYYTDPNVTVYADGHDHPEIIPGTQPKTTILDDFLLEISQNTTIFTDSVLAASETALRIQQAADFAKETEGVFV